jgi:hypothetical protein
MDFAEKSYPDNVLEGYRNGCLLDLRVRFAMQLMQGPMFANCVTDAVGQMTPDEIDALPGMMSGLALDTAVALLADAEARGLVEALPTGAEIGGELLDQAKRTALFQVVQQLSGQAAAADEQGKVVAVQQPEFMRAARPN